MSEEGCSEGETEMEEEVRDFADRFARLVVSRAFREEGAAEDGARQGVEDDRKVLNMSAKEAELSLRGSQRLGIQLKDDVDELRTRLIPSLRDNARQLHALYIAIDRVSEEVMPQIHGVVKRMEKAIYDLEEMRKEQVDTRGPHGSFGLGLAVGAGLWAPKIVETGVHIPEVFDTDEVFRVEEGGLAPL